MMMTPAKEFSTAAKFILYKFTDCLETNIFTVIPLH